MPKSRLRKNHKKKVDSYKKKVEDQKKSFEKKTREFFESQQRTEMERLTSETSAESSDLSESVDMNTFDPNPMQDIESFAQDFQLDPIEIDLSQEEQ